MDTSQVTRFEVIDHRPQIATYGRAFTALGCAVTLSLQDEGRTLKVFITSSATTTEAEVAQQIREGLREWFNGNK